VNDPLKTRHFLARVVVSIHYRVGLVPAEHLASQPCFRAESMFFASGEIRDTFCVGRFPAVNINTFEQRSDLVFCQLVPGNNLVSFH